MPIDRGHNQTLLILLTRGMTAWDEKSRVQLEVSLLVYELLHNTLEVTRSDQWKGPEWPQLKLKRLTPK